MLDTQKLSLPKLETSEERVEFLQNNLLPNLSNSQLEKCADYILEALPKEERKTKKILTPNRLTTIKKRETSYENLTQTLEGGEDALHNLITQNHNCYLTPPSNAEIAGTQQLENAISDITEKRLSAKSTDRGKLRQAEIDLRKTKYIEYNSEHPIMYLVPTPLYTPNYSIDLDEHRWINEDGEPESDGLINLFNADHISAILRNTLNLLTFAENNPESDMHYFIYEFLELADRALNKKPKWKKIAVWKILEKTNEEIQSLLLEKFGNTHSLSYISILWRKKIPAFIAEQAKQDYIYQRYFALGKTKVCTHCKKVKPAHKYFFSFAPKTTDGYYTICRECRKTNRKEE